jgi:hypothetical protein
VDEVLTLTGFGMSATGVIVGGYLFRDLKCCLGDAGRVMQDFGFLPGIYAVEQCKSWCGETPYRCCKRNTSSETTYQYVRCRTFPNAAQKVYDDSFQFNVLIMECFEI